MAVNYWTGLAPLVAQVATATWATWDITTTRKVTIGGVVVSALDGYSFTITAGNATVGATYTNNAQTFTVLATISGATTLYCSGTGAPAASGTLTKATGTGDATIAFSAFAGTLTAALAGLAAVLNAGLVSGVAHPYFTSITWTSDATHITGTAKVTGCAFIFAGSVNGVGAGTCSNAYTVTTANSGPNDWNVAGNWSVAVPLSGDTVIFANNSTNVCWGLSTGVTGVTVIRVEQSYTGNIGLNYLGFATTANGATVNTSYLEYRQLYCAIGTASLRIGDASSIGTNSGSPRCMFDIGTATACTVDIINTAGSSVDTNRPCVRLLGNNNLHAINIRSGSGGIGLCAEVPGETSTVKFITVADTSSASKFVSGRGLTIASGGSFSQDGGVNTLQSDQTIPLVTAVGGLLTNEGAGTITAMSALGGTVYSNNTGSGSIAITTLTLRGGTVNMLSSSVARTVSSVLLYKNSDLIYDPTVVTVSAITAQERLNLATS